MTSIQPFHEKLEQLMDEYVHFIYQITKIFPRDELYGVTSQLRRATLSVILNYIEGYARIHEKVYKNFLQISYGSLKESKYLIKFSFKEGYITQEDHGRAIGLAEEIGAMLWGVISKISVV